MNFFCYNIGMEKESEMEQLPELKPLGFSKDATQGADKAAPQEMTKEWTQGLATGQPIIEGMPEEIQALDLAVASDEPVQKPAEPEFVELAPAAQKQAYSNLEFPELEPVLQEQTPAKAAPVQAAPAVQEPGLDPIELAPAPLPAEEPPAETPSKKLATKSPAHSRLPMILAGLVLGLVAISLLIIFSIKYRAENVTSFLDATALKGLVVDQTFSPQSGKRYVQVNEGLERSVSAVGSGATLPVISRNNYRAFTPKNYEIIGTAPWALSINVSSNIEDPELLRYLFNQDAMTKAFLARPAVAAMLENETSLAQAVANEEQVRAFFEDEVVQKALASAEVLEAFAGSRFFAYLLLSEPGKFYRNNPAAAAKLIQASPTLTALKQNANVRKVLSENSYLKKIAPILLK